MKHLMFQMFYQWLLHIQSKHLVVNCLIGDFCIYKVSICKSGVGTCLATSSHLSGSFNTYLTSSAQILASPLSHTYVPPRVFHKWLQDTFDILKHHNHRISMKTFIYLYILTSMNYKHKLCFIKGMCIRT